MIQSVKNYSVSELFYADASVVYKVPRYQREYAWTKNQWENLIDDILHNETGYFLGSLICINRSTDGLDTQFLELVDGQQRLTTLSLLLAATYKTLSRFKSDLDEDQLFELVNLKRKLVLKKGKDQTRVVPQIQNNNRTDYFAILAQIGVIKDGEVPPYAGNRKLFRAYRYYLERVEMLLNERDDEVQVLLDFLNKVSSACLIKIDVASHSDAYILFESLNNRGMPLTAIDLIKNKLLAELERSEPDSNDTNFGRWSRLLSHLGEDYAIQERFFRQYYNAFKSEISEVINVPMATRSNLIRIYEKLISNDAEECLLNISKAGEIYGKLISNTQDYDISDFEKSLRDLERIQGAPSYVLMLYLLVNKDTHELNEADLTEVANTLVSFFVRRHLTDAPATRDLTRLFMVIIENLNGVLGQNLVDSIRNKLVEVSANDQVYKEKLSGPIYDDNAAVTRFVLCALAEQGMTKETWVNVWRSESKKYVWTIEHIFPQGENIPVGWVEMITGGDRAKAVEIQQQQVHCIGNLTVSGFNSTLGNKIFSEKRDRVDRQGRAVGYKNGFNLNEGLANAEHWSEDQIKQRTSELVDRVMNLFSLS